MRRNIFGSDKLRVNAKILKYFCRILRSMPNLITCIINFFKWLFFIIVKFIANTRKNPYLICVESQIWLFDGQGYIDMLLIKISSGLGDIILLMNSECLGTTYILSNTI